MFYINIMLSCLLVTGSIAIAMSIWVSLLIKKQDKLAMQVTELQQTNVKLLQTIKMERIFQKNVLGIEEINTQYHYH